MTNKIKFVHLGVTVANLAGVQTHTATFVAAIHYFTNEYGNACHQVHALYGYDNWVKVYNREYSSIESSPSENMTDEQLGDLAVDRFMAAPGEYEVRLLNLQNDRVFSLQEYRDDDLFDVQVQVFGVYGLGRAAGFLRREGAGPAAIQNYLDNCAYTSNSTRGFLPRASSAAHRVRVLRSIMPTPQWEAQRHVAKRTEGRAAAQELKALMVGWDDFGLDEVELIEFLQEHFEGNQDTGDRIVEAMDNKYGECTGINHADCGHWHNGITTYVNGPGEEWCEACVDDRTEIAADNGRRYPTEDLHWSDARDAYFSYPIRDDDDDGDEDSCDADEDSCSYDNPDLLMCYSVNALNKVARDETFTPGYDTDLLMGVELEMVLPGRQRNYIPAMRSVLGHEYAIFKSDGSLPHYGAELVSGPRRMADHIERLSRDFAPSGSTAWDSGDCGMHVHIDSRHFSKLSLGKFIMFINRKENTKLVKKIAGRHYGSSQQAREYCRHIGDEYDGNPKLAKEGPRDRYRMVNITGLDRGESQRLGVPNPYGEGKYNTVELRIFRASLRKERLLAQLEFTHAAVKFTKDASWNGLGEAEFLAWLRKHVSSYPNLAKWFAVVTPKVTAQRPVADVVTTDEAVLDSVEV